jgi:hypothetical protein
VSGKRNEEARKGRFVMRCQEKGRNGFQETSGEKGELFDTFLLSREVVVLCTETRSASSAKKLRRVIG